MKISELIKELQRVEKEYGDIEAQLQNNPKPDEPVIGYESFFIIPEEYLIENEKVTICNIRTWPY